MLQFFRRNLLVNIVSLFVFTIGLFAYYLLFQDKYTPEVITIPFEHIHGIKIPFADTFLIQFICGIGLIFAQAIMVSQFIIKHKMSRSLSLIPGAIMVLYCALTLQPGFSNTILLANLFFILSIGTLFKVYKVFNPISNIFNSGFFLSIATFLYKPYFIYIMVIIFGLIALRSLKVKEVIQLILGFLCPLFLFGVLLFYHDNIEVFLEYLKIKITIPKVDLTDIRSLLKPILVLATVIILIVNQNVLRKKKKFDAIKKIELNYWILFWGIFTVFFTQVLTEGHLLIVSLPIALLGGLIMESKENSITKEFVFVSLIGFYFALVFDVF